MEAQEKRPQYMFLFPTTGYFAVAASFVLSGLLGILKNSAWNYSRVKLCSCAKASPGLCRRMGVCQSLLCIKLLKIFNFLL